MSPCACASVFYVPFFFHPDIFIASSPSPFSSNPSHPICVSSLSPHHRVKTETTFSTFSVHVLLQHLTKRASSVPGITLSDNLITFSSLINTSGDTPPPVGPWFSCRALWVRIQPDFPLGMMSFQFGCMSRERKGAEKKGKKNTVSKNRTMECKLTGMKSIRRGGKCVSSYL